MVGRSALVAVLLLVAGCGLPGTEPSGDVIERLLASDDVDEAEAERCHAALPAVLLPAGPPPVLATDRATYEAVIEPMQDAPELLEVIPELPADAEVTLCLMDTREMPATRFDRTVLAVSGDESWWAGGQDVA